jgi:hypothetical protein
MAGPRLQADACTLFLQPQVKEVPGTGRSTWLALDYKLMPSPLPENLKISTPPELTAASFEGEYLDS